LEEAAAGDRVPRALQLEEHEVAAAHHAHLAVPGRGLPEVDLVDVLLLRQEVEPVEIGDRDPGVHATRSSTGFRACRRLASSCRKRGTCSPAAAFLVVLGLGCGASEDRTTGYEVVHNIQPRTDNGKGNEECGSRRGARRARAPREPRPPRARATSPRSSYATNLTPSLHPHHHLPQMMPPHHLHR